MDRYLVQQNVSIIIIIIIIIIIAPTISNAP